MDKEYPVPGLCPVCGGSTRVQRVRCTGCGTAVEGQFALGWIQTLSVEQREFARVFLECRGKIKDVERALGVSYPTVVSRLDDVVVAMTGKPAPPRAAQEGGGGREQRRKEVLDALAAGTLSAEEATRLIREGSDGSD